MSGILTLDMNPKVTGPIPTHYGNLTNLGEFGWEFGWIVRN
jgi:hypothetical protein